MNNGHSTGYFLLKRGTRQGDPLSAYLFILALEVMLFQLRSNEQIEGIKINDFEVKLPTLMILISSHLISSLFWPYLIHVKHFRNSLN